MCCDRSHLSEQAMTETDFYVPDQVSLKLVPTHADLTHESAKTEGKRRFGKRLKVLP